MTHHTPIWLLFSSGEGPAECALAVAKLWDHFQSKAQLAGFHAELVEYQKGPQPQTFESVLVAIKGPNLETFVNPWLWAPFNGNARVPIAPNTSARIGLSVSPKWQHLLACARVSIPEISPGKLPKPADPEDNTPTKPKPPYLRSIALRD